jgi:hypothetical protein
LSDEILLEAVAAFRAAGGNKARAARSLNLGASTYCVRLSAAARAGLLGATPVLPGFEIGRTTQVTDADGNVERNFVQQRPERGPEFEVPEGHLVRGVSALVDGNGNTIQQWIKTRQGDVAVAVDSIKAAFEAYDGKARSQPAPKIVDQKLATVYVVSDHHLGMYAWKAETGADYDVEIGERLLKDAMEELVTNAPKSGTAVILNLGDFFHSDNDENRTRRSGNILDVDTRYARVLQAGVALMIHCAKFALRKHRKVIIRCLQGNHDPYAALALAVALAAFFSKDPRVEVDTSPSPFWWWRFGRVLLGATHGDMTKPVDMPGVMASHCAEDWGATEYRYAYFGHVHHRSVGGGENAGVVWETFQVLAPKDSWHNSKGYVAGRSMVAITHHRDRGEVLRHTVAIPKFHTPKK